MPDQAAVKITTEVLDAMKVVVNFMEDILTTPVQEVLVVPAKKRKRKVTRVHYSEQERQQIRDLFTIGKSNRQIAKAMGRTEAAISVQLSVLGLTKKTRKG
jgi:DNA-binding NarL/FixJ family response regulator